MTSRILRFAAPVIAGLVVGFAIQSARAEETVAGLMRDPKHLDEVEHGCKINAPWATEALCKIAGEAVRRRFRGEGVPYTPHPVDPFPSQPDPKSAHPPASKPEAHHRPASARPSAIL